MARNGKIYLAKNIKMDKNYKSVLGYTESQMLELITNPSNLVYYQDDYSFMRETGTIQIKCKYSQAVQSNYIAFQNPDYSSKYFFAFVDEVKYLSENSSEIKYTIDVWTTWWEYWSYKACFVVREHVLDDTVGLHTLPENVELGDYVCSSSSDMLVYGSSYSDYYIVLAVTKYPGTTAVPGANVGGTMYGGVFSGLAYITGEDYQGVNHIIRSYNDVGGIDSIKSIFLVPKTMVSEPTWITVAGWSYNVKYGQIPATTDEYGLTIMLGNTPTTLANNYNPVNKKLLTFPYIFLNVDNNVGSCVSYKYEDFYNNIIAFNLVATITPGCSYKLSPLNYKNIESNYLHSIIPAKLPICNWENDLFTNYMTQNGLNVGLNLIDSTVELAAGNVVGGIKGIANTISQVYKHSLVPPSLEGNINSSDVNFTCGLVNPIAYHMSIKPEYASVIDKYFTRMGYAVNTVKVPNVSHRQNYNYVQIAEEENVAYPNNHNNIGIPAKALNEINTLFRNGITIWNNHTNFGDYSVSNNITQ